VFHCTYLLYKFVLFDYYSLCLVTDCSIRVSRSFTGGCSPPALRVATPIWLWLWNIQYSGTALLLLVNPFILHRNNRTACPTYVFLSSEKKMLRYQPCSTHYAAVRINNCLKTTFVIKVATMKIMDDLMEAITCLPLNWHFSWWTKMNGTQRRDVLSPWRTHCIYRGMEKGTSLAKATSNSEKIRPVALAICCWIILSGDERGRHHNRPKKVPEEAKEKVREYIMSFPQRKTHYSQKDNRKRKYLSENLSFLGCMICI